MRVPLKDGMVLNVDGILPVDPALGLRQRAQAFIKSRQWSTASIYYGDAPDGEHSEDKRRWGMCFCLGLDHVRTSKADWFTDVAAIIHFLEPVARETGSEFRVEFRLKSRLWYSETLDFITGEHGEEVNLTAVRSMLEQFTARKQWWRMSDSAFKQRWPRERRRGRIRFIMDRGVLPWGLILGLGWSALAGRGVTGSLPPLRVVLWFVAGIACGAGIGAWRWAMAERRYKGLMAHRLIDTEERFV